MRKVLDSWAMIAWLQAEDPARQKVRRLLRDAEAGRLDLLMSMINVGEEAEAFLGALPGMPIRALLPTDRLIVGAARLKSRFNISYADAFAVETAREQKAALVSGDPEFRVLAGDGAQRPETGMIHNSQGLSCREIGRE